MRHRKILYIVSLLYFSCESVPETVQKSDTSVTEEPLQSETYMYYAFAKDIPLGSNLIESDLKYYSYYGQFIDGKLLDFYTAEYPGFSFLNRKPSSVVLEYRNGILVRKRYSFDQDIFEILDSYFLKKINYKLKDGTRVIGLNFPYKKWTYNRVPPFYLYESITNY